MRLGEEDTGYADLEKKDNGKEKAEDMEVHRKKETPASVLRKLWQLPVVREL